jgi:hypothetical protein
MKLVPVTFLLVATIGIGCHSIPYPRYPGEEYKIGDKKITQEKAEKADAYCSRVATNADATSQLELGFGIFLGLVAGAAVITGSAIGPDTSSDANWAEKNRNALILGSGGLLSVPTTILLMRSKDASRASARATEALTNTGEDERMNACLKARAELVGARGVAADVAGGKPGTNDAPNPNDSVQPKPPPAPSIQDPVPPPEIAPVEGPVPP